MDEVGLHWLWVDDVPAVAGGPSDLEVCHYFDVLSIPIAGGAGIRRYEGSDRVSYTRKVIITWELLGRLIEASSFLRQGLAKVLAGT